MPELGSEMAEGSRSGCGIQKLVEEPGVDGQVEVDTATKQRCFIHLTVLELASVPGQPFDHNRYGVESPQNNETLFENLSSIADIM